MRPTTGRTGERGGSKIPDARGVDGIPHPDRLAFQKAAGVFVDQLLGHLFSDERLEPGLA